MHDPSERERKGEVQLKRKNEALERSRDTSMDVEAKHKGTVQHKREIRPDNGLLLGVIPGFMAAIFDCSSS